MRFFFRVTEKAEHVLHVVQAPALAAGHPTRRARMAPARQMVPRATRARLGPAFEVVSPKARKKYAVCSPMTSPPAGNTSVGRPISSAGGAGADPGPPAPVPWRPVSSSRPRGRPARNRRAHASALLPEGRVLFLSRWWSLDDFRRRSQGRGRRRPRPFFARGAPKQDIDAERHVSTSRRIGERSAAAFGTPGRARATWKGPGRADDHGGAALGGGRRRRVFCRRCGSGVKSMATSAAANAAADIGADRDGRLSRSGRPEEGVARVGADMPARPRPASTAARDPVEQSAAPRQRPRTSMRPNLARRHRGRRFWSQEGPISTEPGGAPISSRAAPRGQSASSARAQPRRPSCPSLWQRPFLAGKIGFGSEKQTALGLAAGCADARRGARARESPAVTASQQLGDERRRDVSRPPRMAGPRATDGIEGGLIDSGSSPEKNHQANRRCGRTISCVARHRAGSFF